MQSKNSKVIIRELGEKVKAYRIDFPLTQKELADKSGVSVRSIQNFEYGEDIQLSNLIKILKALELENKLSLLVPDVTRKPSMCLEKPRQRVRQKREKKAPDTSFVLGEDRR